MHKPLYAVIDTNVVVSALLKPDSVPGQVFMRALTGEITPVLSIGIREEYVEVLARKKFKFDQELVGRVLAAFEEKAVYRSPAHNPDALALVPDPKDVEIYAVTLSAREEWEARLVTGNTKHFPQTAFVVTPRQMLDLLEEQQ
jgi:putative PIN family toxin of toxin-antitoxin system